MPLADKELFPAGCCTFTETGEEAEGDEEEEEEEEDPAEPELFGGLPCTGFDMFWDIIMLNFHSSDTFRSQLSKIVTCFAS